jgi:CO/xanthine dehydrogenase FAD-binding subunit
MALGLQRVNSVNAAAKAMAAGSGVRWLAGGTLLMREINAGDISVQTLLVGDGIGLDRIDVRDGTAAIGAAVTMAAVAAHPDVDFLAAVAESIGGPAVRNMATVGGNLFAPYPYGDFTVALLALGATVTVVGSERSETIDLESFLQNRQRSPAIVTGVAFELPPAGTFRFVKVVRRKPHGASVLSIAAVLPMTGRKVAGARVAYGAMASVPIRARAVERALEGRPLDAAGIAEAALAATEGCKPQSDPQASAWYRLQVLPVHLTRLLSGEAAA